MKSLKLFNVVLAKTLGQFIVDQDLGIIIDSTAVWAKDQILSFYRQQKLSGNDLNKTFYQSWATIRDSSRTELFVDQIIHYLATYGTDFEGEMYIPNQCFDRAQIPYTKCEFKVIQGVTEEELTTRCLNLLRSGIALQQDTLVDVFAILDELDYTFTGDEGIRNKEAIIMIADLYGIYPKDTVEFLRYCLFRSTGDSLLIKSDAVIAAIKSNTWVPSHVMKQHGLEKLATIFNRFKPLFLAYKNKSAKTINRISKLSKKFHKPMVANPLNLVTERNLEFSDMHWLHNATPYALFKAFSACYQRLTGQDTFMYRVRNSKSWVTTSKFSRESIWERNQAMISAYLRDNYNLSGLKVYIPKNVEYALPTSEKLFVGNIPTGTKFTGKVLNAGVYWENSWGANDLDLSGLNIGGKIGWNAAYKSGSEVFYSGDITNAPEGAVEYLRVTKDLSAPTLVLNNVYSGSSTCDYKIVVGKGSKVDNTFMMNPNKVLLDVACKSIQTQTILGMFIPNDGKVEFVLLNFGAGHCHVSGNNVVSNMATKALYQQWSNPLMLKDILQILDVVFVDTPEEADVDLSLSKLEKDTFTKLFTKVPEMAA